MVMMRAVDTRNRIGFAVKVMGRDDLPSHDMRRWQSKPHLRVSLSYLGRIFDYLDATGIRMYRMASDLAPYITKPDLPSQHRQIEESGDELVRLGERARAMNLRLSLHPSQYIVLNTPDERVLDTAIRTYQSQAAILDGMGLGLEHKIITHVGGRYDNQAAALERFAERYERLDENVQARLIVENDDRLFSVDNVLWLHARCGIPVVFDWLHHLAYNPSGIDDAEAARRCLSTWPQGQRPKIHFSSPREPIKPGRAAPHADYIDPNDLMPFLHSVQDAHFDLMLEAKMKDLAVLKTRQDLAQAGFSDRFW